MLLLQTMKYKSLSNIMFMAGCRIGLIYGFGSVIDAINTIRNNASVAHPNDALLGEAEAALAVNVIRTLFHYISTKVRQ